MRVLVVTGLDMQGSSSTSNAMCVGPKLTTQTESQRDIWWVIPTTTIVIEPTPQNDFKTHYETGGTE